MLRCREEHNCIHGSLNSPKKKRAKQIDAALRVNVINTWIGLKFACTLRITYTFTLEI